VRVWLQVLLAVIDSEGVLELHVNDAPGIPVEHLDGIDARDGELARVDRQPDECRIGALQEPVKRIATAQRGQEVDVQRGPHTMLCGGRADGVPAGRQGRDGVLVERIDVAGGRCGSDEQHAPAECRERLGVPRRTLDDRRDVGLDER
jgi:hypothetical protein